MNVDLITSWGIAGVISAFLILSAFNVGRLTNSTVALRSSCDLEESELNGLKPSWYSSNLQPPAGR